MKRSFIAFILLAILMLGPVAAAEEVRTTAGGLTLNANLEATDGWPAGPVVLLTRGTPVHRGMEIISDLQSMLAERGLSSLAINLSLSGIPVVVVAGTEDKVVTGLIEKIEPLTDSDEIELILMDGADHAFRDLYSEDIADALAERVGE